METKIQVKKKIGKQLVAQAALSFLATLLLGVALGVYLVAATLSYWLPGLEAVK